MQNAAFELPDQRQFLANFVAAVSAGAFDLSSLSYDVICSQLRPTTLKNLNMSGMRLVRALRPLPHSLLALCGIDTRREKRFWSYLYHLKGRGAIDAVAGPRLSGAILDKHVLRGHLDFKRGNFCLVVPSARQLRADEGKDAFAASANCICAPLIASLSSELKGQPVLLKSMRQTWTLVWKPARKANGGATLTLAASKCWCTSAQRAS